VRQDSPVLEFSCHGMQHLMLRRRLQYSPLSPTTQAIKLSSTNITARYRNKTSEKLKYIDVDNKHIIHRKVTLKPPAVPALMIRSDFKVYMDEVGLSKWGGDNSGMLVYHRQKAVAPGRGG
jgi:hypothetical protein